MRLILLGPPGAGKGTQAQFVCENLRVPQISTGDMLRAAIAAGSELGKRVKQVMDDGLLVSDEIIIALVKERIAQDDCANGFLFDGFPRTIVQAQAMVDAGVELDCVVEIQVPDEQIVARLGGRRVHPGSGRVYHIEFNPPAVAGTDDDTGEDLIQSEDDSETVVRDRLRVYHEQTHPLVEFYSAMAEQSSLRYIGVSGVGSVDSIKEAILSKISSETT